MNKQSWQVIFKSGSQRVVIKDGLTKQEAIKIALVVSATLKFVGSETRCMVTKARV